MNRGILRGLRKDGVTGRHKRVSYGGKGSDYTTTSTTYAAIDAVNLPFVYLDLEVGDEVECHLQGSGGHSSSDTAFDFEVDRPASDNTTVGAAFSFGLGMIGAAIADVAQVIHIEGVYTCTEGGPHGFRPVWKVDVGTGHLYNGGATHKMVPVTYLVKNLGPPA